MQKYFHHFARLPAQVGLPIQTHIRFEPFNPETTIRYQLPEETSVKLQIYNLRGHMVRTLVDTKMKAGEATTTWDGKDEAGNRAPSGVYFYRLQAHGGEWTSTRKMIVIR